MKSKASPFPGSPLQTVISVQTLHHLPHPKQKEVYRFVHRRLEPGGLFLLMDRIKLLDTPLHPGLRRYVGLARAANRAQEWQGRSTVPDGASRQGRSPGKFGGAFCLAEGSRIFRRMSAPFPEPGIVGGG